MTTDPKKNDEIKDEELDMVSGGAGGQKHDEQTDGDPVSPSSSTGKGGREGV